MGEAAAASIEIDGGAAAAMDVDKDPSLARWESLLPRTVLRVLLVEGDDSTRHIIAALLRRCSYKVAAISDGLRAWAILKEKPQSVDLILTEVELPSVSGFSLLTMIMEHEICNRIPVIMMSSQDSMSLVFKCMLRGAADFLVKPIRKNELRNLWQHVWRRQASSGIKHVHQDGSLAGQKFDAISGNNAASNRSSEYLACVRKDKECSEKGSDTESSCTKPDLEVETAGVHNMHEFLQSKSKNISTMTETEVHDWENHIKLGGVSLTGRNTIEGYFLDKKGDKSGLSMPCLELSLKSQQTNYEGKETKEGHTLHHSDSSAFSWYNNRTMQPQPATNFGAEVQHSSHKPFPIHNHELADHAYQWNVVFPDKNPEGTNSPIVGAPVQEKMVIPCRPIGIIPTPIPVRSRVHHALHSSYEALISRLNQSQSGPAKPRENTTSQQDETHFLSHQPLPSQKNNSESTHDPTCISSAVAEGSSTSLCNGSLGHPTGSAGRRACDGNKGNSTAASHGGVTSDCVNGAEVFAHDNTSVGDYRRHASDREAALTKFRLKRKERCFEKKVRYQSRKRLAELRPRVKGQFVRQIHSELRAQPRETDRCRFDSLAA